MHPAKKTFKNTPDRYYLRYRLNGKPLHASEIIFKLNGKNYKKISSDQINKGQLNINKALIGFVDKTLFNAWRGYERTYRGYSFYELLDAVYGKKWRNSKTISFSALDGYKQSANIKKMIKSSANKSGYIAYKETGKKGFSLFNRKSKTVDPGPFYLVWSNFTNNDKASHGDTLKWPYQLKVINIKDK